MKCKREGCEFELMGRQRTFCSDRCRMIESRTDKSNKHKPEQTWPEKKDGIILKAAGVTGATSDESQYIPYIENFGQADCQCMMCRANRADGNRHIIYHGKWDPELKLRDKELWRRTLPGDSDYGTGISQICIDTDALTASPVA